MQTRGIHEISWDEWVQEYKPVPNQKNPNASWDGFLHFLHEMFGRASENIDSRHIWTLLDSDDSDVLFVVNGCHFVNRVGYFRTEKPWPENTTIEVVE